MILSTTPVIEGRPASAYLGIVAGEAIVGANMVRDMFASLTDMIGGRSGSYEGVLKDARETALAEVAKAAEKLGADAVVGIHVSYGIVGNTGSMLMVNAIGTAVRL
jgi:uncharacterized protein YbjQ (UPF0145 family)